MSLGVSIVTFNTPEGVLARLVESISGEGVPHTILICDNSPRPTEYPALAARGVRYIHAGVNLGYGRGHNFAIRHFDPLIHPYHLVVNPDVYWSGAVLQPLMVYLEQNRDVALAMPKVLYPDGQLQYLSKLLPNPATLLIRRFLPFAWLQRKVQPEFELRFTGYSSPMNVPYLSGCFMLLRRSAFDHVGGFDERFFMYPEDIDLTRRLNAHWRTMFLPFAHIFHEHGRGSYRSARMLWVHVWNICKYFNKWGWLFDAERRATNQRTLAAIRRSENNAGGAVHD